MSFLFLSKCLKVKISDKLYKCFPKAIDETELINVMFLENYFGSIVKLNRLLTKQK